MKYCNDMCVCVCVLWVNSEVLDNAQLLSTPLTFDDWNASKMAIKLRLVKSWDSAISSHVQAAVAMEKTGY